MGTIVITKSSLNDSKRPLRYLENIDFNLGPYSIEQASQLLSGEFRGQITYKNSEYFNGYPEQIPYKKEVTKTSTKYIIEEIDFLNWWNDTILNNTVEISINDYIFTLKFALANYIKNHNSTTGMTGQARDLNQKLSNDIAGKLAEIGFIKYAQTKYNVHLTADFALWDNSVFDNDYQYDIRTINDKEVNKNYAVEIKSTKLKSSIQDVRGSENFKCLIQAKLSLPEMHLLYFLDSLSVLEKISQTCCCEKSEILRNDYKTCEEMYNKYLSRFFEWKNLPVYISGLKYKEDLFYIENGTLPCVNAEVSNRLFTFSTLLDNSNQAFENLFNKMYS